MRLLTKTTLCFFAAMVVLLFCTGYYLYRQFSGQLRERSDKELLAEEAGWIQYLENNTGPGVNFVLRTREVSVFPTDERTTAFAALRDVSGDMLNADRHILYRELRQVAEINGLPYLITIRKSQEQQLALLDGFTRIILLVFAGLFIITVIFNWILNRALWVPFNRSLAKIRRTELSQMDAVRFEKTDTYEFNELNTALNSMTEKISRDFRNMKEFTENAAHEMQTPVAVVQGKIELLLQDRALTDTQLQSLAEASEVLNRLGKLNQGLLLLSRIENDQFATSETISLRSVTEKYLGLFSDLIKGKELKVETNFTGDPAVKLHPVLADSLLSNLLGNAIRYNYSGGYIRVEMNASELTISNSSRLEPISGEKLFTRFYASRQAGENSNGLGLAIVSRIAATGGLTVGYHAENGVHTFTLTKKLTGV